MHIGRGSAKELLDYSWLKRFAGAPAKRNTTGTRWSARASALALWSAMPLHWPSSIPRAPALRQLGSSSRALHVRPEGLGRNNQYNGLSPTIDRPAVTDQLHKKLGAQQPSHAHHHQHPQSHNGLHTDAFQHGSRLRNAVRASAAWAQSSAEWWTGLFSPSDTLSRAERLWKDVRK